MRKLLRTRAASFAAVSDGTDCLRLCAGRGDGIAGLLVDRFGPLLVATDYAEPGERTVADDLVRVLREGFPGPPRSALSA